MYRTVFWSLGEGEGGMIWENGTETCIMSYVKQTTSPGLKHDSGCLGLVHWDNLFFFFVCFCHKLDKHLKIGRSLLKAER